MTESVSPPGGTGALPRRVIIRVALVFLALLALFALLLDWSVFEAAVVEPVTRLETVIAAAVLELCGADVRTAGTSLGAGDFSMNILNGCNGVYALSIFLAAVLAYPSRWLEKAAGIALGSAFLFAVNTVRILSLFVVGVFLPDWLEWFHVYFWQTLIVLVSLLAWFTWEEHWVHHA